LCGAGEVVLHVEAEPLRDPGVAVEVPLRDGLLDPADVVSGERAGATDRLARGPGLVRVDEQVRTGTDRLAYVPDTTDVLVERPATDLRLERGEPLLGVAPVVAAEFVGRDGSIEPRAVGGNVRTVAPEERVERPAGTWPFRSHSATSTALRGSAENPTSPG